MTKEEQIKLREEKVKQISKQIKKFLEKNSAFLESQNQPEQENEENNKKKNKKGKIIDINTKKINEQKFNAKLKYGEKIRNEQIINGYIEKPNDNKDKEVNGNINSTELPKIITPLFTQNEKKVLGNIIPEKEIKKYEKRYEFLDKEKNNLLRKHAFETKKLEKEKADLEKNLIWVIIN